MDTRDITLRIQKARAATNSARNQPDLTGGQANALNKIYAVLDDLELNLHLGSLDANIESLKQHSDRLNELCIEIKNDVNSIQHTMESISAAAVVIDHVVAGIQELLKRFPL